MTRWKKRWKAAGFLIGQEKIIEKNEEILSVDPYNVDALLALAKTLLKKEPEDSIRFLLRAQNAGHYDGSSSRLTAKAYFLAWELDKEIVENLEQAFLYYQDCLNFVENTVDPNVHFELCKVYLAYGSYDGALHVMSKLISGFPTFPKLPKVILLAASVLKYLKEYDQAWTYFTYLIDSPPGNLSEAAIMFQLAHLSELQGKKMLASEGYKEVWLKLRGISETADQYSTWKRWRNSYDAWNDFGEQYMTEGAHILAVDAFTTALSLSDGNDPAIWIRLSRASFLINDLQYAYEALEYAESLDPGHYDVVSLRQELQNCQWRREEKANDAASNLQAQMRGRWARRQAGKRHEAIRTIQRAFRCYLAKQILRMAQRNRDREMQVVATNLKKIMMRLQKRCINSWRANAINLKLLRKVVVMSTGSVKRRIFYRMKEKTILTKRRLRILNTNASIIQRFVRTCNAKRILARARAYQEKLEARARTLLKRIVLRKLLASLNQWQEYSNNRRKLRSAFFRINHRYIARAMEGWRFFHRKAMEEKNDAAIHLQSMIRQRNSRRDLHMRKRKKGSAIKIQAGARRFLQRYTLQTLRLEEDKRIRKLISKIVARWRGRTVFGAFQSMRKNAVHIQRAVRGFLCRLFWRRKIHALWYATLKCVLHKTWKSAVHIQRILRGLFARRELVRLRREHASKQIQRVYRGASIRHTYILPEYMLVKIRHWRSRYPVATWLLHEKCTVCAIRIQRVYWGYQHRRMVKRMKRRMREFWAHLIVKDITKPDIIRQSALRKRRSRNNREMAKHELTRVEKQSHIGKRKQRDRRKRMTNGDSEDYEVTTARVIVDGVRMTDAVWRRYPCETPARLRGDIEGMDSALLSRQCQNYFRVPKKIVDDNANSSLAKSEQKIAYNAFGGASRSLNNMYIVDQSNKKMRTSKSLPVLKKSSSKRNRRRHQLMRKFKKRQKVRQRQLMHSERLDTFSRQSERGSTSLSDEYDSDDIQLQTIRQAHDPGLLRSFQMIRRRCMNYSR
eukprot:g215.t1